MRQEQDVIEIATRGRGLVETTEHAAAIVRRCGMETGLLTLFCQHTSCSLVIQENADPDVRTDLEAYFDRLAPEGMDFIVHTLEGPDDMPAHIRAALTQTTLSIPVRDGAMALGTWQGIYLFEHRRRPHRRRIVAHLVGE